MITRGGSEADGFAEQQDGAASGVGFRVEDEKAVDGAGPPVDPWVRALSSGRQWSSTRRSAVLRSGNTFCAPTIQIAPAAPPA
jgi:hypothetical protein